MCSTTRVMTFVKHHVNNQCKISLGSFGNCALVIGHLIGPTLDERTRSCGSRWEKDEEEEGGSISQNASLWNVS